MAEREWAAGDWIDFPSGHLVIVLFVENGEVGYTTWLGREPTDDNLKSASRMDIPDFAAAVRERSGVRRVRDAP